jgi:hypothetical protein
VREGFAESGDFGRTVLWALMLDAPRGLDRIDCPVTWSRAWRTGSLAARRCATCRSSLGPASARS